MLPANMVATFRSGGKVSVAESAPPRAILVIPFSFLCTYALATAVAAVWESAKFLSVGQGPRLRKKHGGRRQAAIVADALESMVAFLVS